MKYSKKQLQTAVRVEKMTLVQEKSALVKRVLEIEKRLDELEKAEGLLEGE